MARACWIVVLFVGLVLTVGLTVRRRLVHSMVRKSVIGPVVSSKSLLRILPLHKPPEVLLANQREQAHRNIWIGTAASSLDEFLVSLSSKVCMQ